MRFPLRNQIFVPFAGLMVLAVVLFTGISAWHAAEVRRNQTAEHMKAVTDALGNASYPLTDDVVRRIGAMIDGEVVVLDDQQNFAASTLATDEDLRRSLAELPTATADASSTYSVRWNSSSYLVTSIQRTTGRRPQTLHVILATDELSDVWKNSLLAPAIAAAVILVLGLLVARLLSSRIATRFDQLSSLFNRLAEGDFSPIKATGRNDELRDLMNSANVLSEQLRTMQDELVTAERLQLLGQLSGGLAHQLKNSVAGARLAIQLHQRRCTSQDPMVQTALAQLALTEEQVLAVVSLKPETESPSEPTTCDLSQMAGDVAALLQSHCSHWKSVLTLDVPNSLSIHLVSPQGLKGALLNLMQNAIEAAGVGGTIGCRLAAGYETITIEICDSGPGFGDQVDRLQGAFRTTKPEGMGLGLTIAQHAVEQEGGALTFHRIDDQTCVQIKLPIKSQPEASELPSMNSEACHSAADNVVSAQSTLGKVTTR